MKYIESISELIKEYYSILSPEKPDFLEEYIQTPEMQIKTTIYKCYMW